MSVKTDVIAILTAKKDEQVANVTAVYDGMIAQVTALSDDVPADVAALQQELSDTQATLAGVQAAFDADEVSLANEKDQEAKLQAKLDAIKAALEA